ncbi:MAG: 2-oxoglutarate dehydrogenase E1 component [Candidatus Dasytiphilus stammeri]
MYNHSTSIKYWLDTSWLTGINQSWVEQLYKDFLKNPNSVEHKWRSMFQKMMRSADVTKNICHASSKNKFKNLKQTKVLKLIDAYRWYGHQKARLNPIGGSQQKSVPYLEPSFYDLLEEDLNKYLYVDIESFYDFKKEIMTIADLYRYLKKIYSGSIGFEYMHLSNIEERRWIQQYIESINDNIVFSRTEKKNFLEEITAAEEIEHYLGTKFPGTKRFSLEGGEALVPMLKEVIRHAGESGIGEIFFGMAHRGRINVLINVVGKPPKYLFDEFSGKYEEIFGTGDVKYHMGYSSDIKTIKGDKIHLTLEFNPSHLEIVNPVVMGSVRACLDKHRLTNPNYKVLPITIHGDAAIIGQGVMQETLNFSKVRAYDIGGTLRIVINNQIGFTTSNLSDARSTQYCTDIGKMVEAPIFHVNADDIEATIFVTRLALNFLRKFKRDVFIDLVCYRRHGHNEVDEPSVTQPIMYKKIKNHPTIRQIYVKKLMTEQVVTLQESQKISKQYREQLDIGTCVVAERCTIMEKNFLRNSYNISNQVHLEKNSREGESKKNIQKLAKCISDVPNYIQMQSIVAKIYQARRDMAEGKKPFDWGAAENLAYANLLYRGISIRLSGEDVSRGTFAHRHAVIHNQIDGSTYIPLQHLPKDKEEQGGIFQIWDSVLSEEAVLAFEYGYSSTAQNTLTIWEAQFGDFANGAQIVIDQFISSSEQKWGRLCGLVMLLPHGYEGQGPEHSSARLERYLQLCAELNMQVCIPSTPAQIYHLIERQAALIVDNMPRPLIVMSPKSLLRHPLATSDLYELTNGTFQLVIDEIEKNHILDVKRIILCSGKVYYDLIGQRRKNEQTNISIIRIEQLYPFPIQIIEQIIKKYLHVKDFIWCQEEPFNQGAWSYIQQSLLREVIPSGASLRYVGRPASASPAVGYLFLHQKQQKVLINEALTID